ncbi:hypothetical protein DSECCO2_561690 [anaerobic digester metagenome]
MKTPVGADVNKSEVQLATKPVLVVEASLTNVTYMDPEFAVTGAGTFIPEYDPSRVPVTSTPS